MAFQPPSAKQELQNRKILEDLQQKKQILLKQGQSVPNMSGTMSSVSESLMLSQPQRTALQHAHQTTMGYFIPQESAFGNLILPVLPRFENNQSTGKS